MLRQLESRPHGGELAEEYSEPCQMWRMVLLAKTVNGFQLLTIFAKCSILDV